MNIYVSETGNNNGKFYQDSSESNKFCWHISSIINTSTASKQTKCVESETSAYRHILFSHYNIY